jgi:hypothetical protein
MWKRLGQPLSAKQMVAVTLALLLAGCAVYGLYCGVASIWHRQMVKRSIPDALAGIRAQREILIGLIEKYRTQFGYYPPLFTSAGPARGIMNPLCYELIGVQFDNKRAEFHIPATKDPMSMDEAQRYFNVRWFSNCLALPNAPTNFLANRGMPVQPITHDAEVFGVGLPYTEFTPETCWYDYEISPWRYLTNPAEHNRGKFDLWVDVSVAGKHFTIGNWPEVK